MKKTFGLFLILVVMALFFTGCGDKEVEFTGIYKDGWIGTYIFNNDGTFSCHMSRSQDGRTMNLDAMAGTYTGNPKKDGNLSLNVTKQINQSTIIGTLLTATLLGQTSVTITNENVPLEDVSANQQTMIITIYNGTFTLTTDPDTVFTRQ